MAKQVICRETKMCSVKLDSKKWGSMPIDKCLAPVVDTLNSRERFTISSCCGHGVREGFIFLEAGGVIDFDCPIAHLWIDAGESNQKGSHGK